MFSTNNKNKNGFKGQPCLIPLRIGNLGDVCDLKLYSYLLYIFVQHLDNINKIGLESKSL